MEPKPSKLTPALIGGAIMGFLSSIPVIAAGNCVCCMWIILGGLLAGYYYSKTLPPGVEFQSGDGAVVGLLAGIFGAFFSTFLFYALQSMGFQNMDMMNIFEQVLDSNPEFPAELEDLIREWQTESGFNAVMAVFMLISKLFVNTLFGIIGGILSNNFFKNKKPPRETETTIL
ncbi:hypothetical protein ACFL4L_01410 [bacterium]